MANFNVFNLVSKTKPLFLKLNKTILQYYYFLSLLFLKHI